jgi:hypothetical protein
VSRARAILDGDRARAMRAAVGRLWPSTRKGRALAVVKVGVLVVVLAVGLFAASAVFAIVYDEYGFHPAENARSWAALTPQYADSSACQRCHETEYAPWRAGKHAPVICEACHGPLAQHAATAPETAPAGSLGLPRAPDGLCVTCHEKAAARPATFPQVDLATHYALAPCLGCHDPHVATALVPPTIPHPLENLPACITCHAPAGLKPVPAGHVQSTDAVCRRCHVPKAPGQ